MTADDARSTVVNAIHTIMAGRGTSEVRVAIDTDSHLFDDLEFDSLEVGQLSSMLEDTFGRDPFSDGHAPNTVGEVIAFYEP